MCVGASQTHLCCGSIDERASIAAALAAELLGGANHACLHRSKAAAMLQFETRRHDLYAVVHFAETVTIRDPYAVVVGNVGALVLKRVDRLDVYARRFERHDKHREPLMFCGIGISASEQQHVVGKVCSTRKHLLPV